MATLQEIENKRQEMRKLGIASYRINELSEDESLARVIDEKWSFFFVCVKDPYYQTKAKNGNMRFRIFQTLKEKPQIPMGYFGMPTFSFECYDGKPIQKALEFIKSKVKNQYTYKLNEDEITCIRVIPDVEKKEKLEYVTEGKDGEIYFANWSNCYMQFKAKCQIVKVNYATYKVKLLEAIKSSNSDYSGHNYPENYIITLPKTHPTQQNCLSKN